jgi:hypothetical protein
MSLLHVLLAVALTLRSICTRLKIALVQCRGVRVFVIDVAITFLLSGPANLEILASRIRAFPWAGMSLFMFGQVTGALENLVAVTALLIDVHRWSILLAASHGALDALIGSFVKADRALEGSRGFFSYIW